MIIAVFHYRVVRLPPPEQGDGARCHGGAAPYPVTIEGVPTDVLIVLLAMAMLPLSVVAALLLVAAEPGNSIRAKAGRSPGARRSPRSRAVIGWRSGTRIAAVALVMLAVLTGIQVYRVGEAGAKPPGSGYSTVTSADPRQAAVVAFR